MSLAQIEDKRQSLNQLAEKINDLDEKEMNMLQKISEEMDMLILEYMKNLSYQF